ncbi:glycosyltransferase [Shewanella sp.]|uniref:glycosyltransferase n=1 Tax=Shewanella sp. TaxID=50422 RepID=UPI00356B0CA6
MPIKLFFYGRPPKDIKLTNYEYCDGNPKSLDYDSNQKFSTYRKVLRRIFASIRFYKLLKNSIDKDINTKLLFVDYEYLSLTIFLFFYLRKNPKYIVLHSVNENELGFKNIYKNFFYIVMDRIPNVSYIVNGEYSGELLSQRTTKDITIIQYPTSLDHVRIPKLLAKSRLSLDGVTVISMIGMIRRDKNYHQAISSFSRSKMANNPSFVLLIAGYPSNITANEIIELLKKLGVTNYILKPEYLSDISLHTYYCASDFLLAPYGSKGSSQSGPVSQARLYDLPVITLSGGEIGSYVDREMVGITFKTFDELSYIFDELLSYTSSYDFDSVKEKFSWEKAAEKYLNILQ